MRISTKLSLLTGGAFVAAAILVLLLVRQELRNQALREAKSKACIVLRRNRAGHAYLNHDIWPKVAALIERERGQEGTDGPEREWMNSSSGIRRIEEYMSGQAADWYSYKESALVPGMPPTELDEYEAAFLRRLNEDPTLQKQAEVRMIDGHVFLEVLSRARTEDCCMADAGRSQDSPPTELSVRIPLDKAYAEADRFIAWLAGVLGSVLLLLFGMQTWLYRRLVFRPLGTVRAKALEIAGGDDHLGETIPPPSGPELAEVVSAFNAMSVNLRGSRDELESRVRDRTAELNQLNETLAGDIDRRIKMEARLGLAMESLRESEKRYRLLFDDANDMIFLFLLDNGRPGRFLEANRVALWRLGLTRQELTALTPWDITPPEEHAGLAAAHEQLCLKGLHLFETEIMLKPGQRVPVEVSCRLLEIDDERMVQAIVRDMSDRRQAETVIKQYAEIIADMQIGLLIFQVEDGSGAPALRLVAANPSAYRAIGLSEEESFGREFGEIFPLGDVAAIRDRLVEAARSGVGQSLDEMRRDDSEALYEIRSVPLPGMRIGILLQDITEHRQSEERLRHSLREKEALLGEVHHRVKNNLQVICSLASLQAAHAGDPQVVEQLREIKDRVRSMALVHEKLYRSEDFARIDFAGYLSRLAEELHASYGSMARGVRVQVEVEPVLLDLDRAVPLGLVVNELISNALQHAFGEAGGELRVELRRERDTLLLTVADNGIGLPESVTLDDPKTFGLRLVTLLTQQVEGETTLSRDGGTRFTLSLPLAEGTQGAAA